jgi:AraC-like DNA-binding protein
MDWSPGYREFAPPAGLRDTLSCLWVGITPPGPAQTTLVLPDGAVDLVWQQGARSFLAGPDTGPVPSSAPGGMVTVGARFRPGAGGTVLGLPLSEVLDQQVETADIPALRGRTPSAALPPCCALAALTGLIADLAQRRPADPAMTYAARLLGRPASRAEAVAGELELSERQFRRRCQASVGYGPRTLQRVLRFRRFVSAVDAGPLPGGLADAALAAGYADQSHLTRECVRLSGLTPQALVRARASARVSASASASAS